MNNEIKFINEDGDIKPLLQVINELAEAWDDLKLSQKVDNVDEFEEFYKILKRDRY